MLQSLKKLRTQSSGCLYERVLTMQSRPLFSLILLVSLAFACATANAHHSFGVHYDSKKTGKIEGIAKKFRFTNPHGILEVEVKTDKGEIELWTIETTAPVYMQRRGWSRNTIKPGDKLIVEGWLARDGSHLMRLRKVRLPDGTELGQANPGTSTGE